MPTCQQKSDIAVRREELGVSIYAVARRAGLKWETVQQIELGKRTPRKGTISRINRALDEIGGVTLG